MLNEQWKPIEGFENLYEISNLGRVKRVFNAVSKLDRGQAGRILKINFCSKYPGIGLRKEGKTHYRCLHRLLAKAFIANPFNKPTVNHKNGDKLDWSLDNLEWATYSENLKHALALGLNSTQGATHYKAKLTPDQVYSFRLQWDGTNAWCSSKAAELGLNTNSIRLAVTGKTWKSVPMPEYIPTVKKLAKIKTKTKKLREEISYPQQKLSDAQVLNARLEYNSINKKFGYITKKALALSIDRKTLQKAIVGETFKHLPLSGRD